MEVRDLHVYIGDLHVLRGVDVTIPSGQITGLAGESGSGKSMTALAILGLLPADARTTGVVDHDGTNLLTLSERKRNSLRGSQIGLVFQDPTSSLHPMLSIGTQLTDHMRHHLKLSRHAAQHRAIELLAQVQVPEPEAALKKYPHQFSGGQLQRIAIAIAIACDPQLLIADEPTTALDVTVQAEVLRLLRELCDSTGIGVLLITHDLGVMSAVADTIAVMKDGEVVESGERKQVITRPAHSYTRALIDALPAHERPMQGLVEPSHD